jgi:hypothetical protein
MAVSFGNMGRRGPRRDAQDLDSKVGHAHRQTNELDRTLRREILRPVAEGSQVVDQEPPTIGGINREERRPDRRVLDEVEGGGAM